MYRTNIACKPAGIFQHVGMVVSMRQFSCDQIAKVFDVTARFPKVHGVPVHVGSVIKYLIKSLEPSLTCILCSA